MISYKFITKHADQDGITLLLSVLVLSAIAAITFSLAAIILIEIRASGDEKRTDPAAYATLGVIEQAIFKVQRGVADNILCNTQSGCTGTYIGNPSLATVTVPSVTVSSLQSPDIQDQVPPGNTVDASSGGSLSTNISYTLYDSFNPNDPINGYSYIQLSDVSGGTGTLFYSLCKVNDPANPNDCSAASFKQTPRPSSWTTVQSAIPQGSYNTIGPLAVDRVYKLYISTNSTITKYVGIKTYGPVVTTSGAGAARQGCPAPFVGGDITTCPKGIPLKGKLQYDITANTAGLTRKYRVTIPLIK